jgi:hypothetical protein
MVLIAGLSHHQEGFQNAYWNQFSQPFVIDVHDRLVLR